MARKHAKKFSKKVAVERVPVGMTERRVVTQPDGTFVVIPATPVYKQGKAYESTSTKGQRNTGPERKGK